MKKNPNGSVPGNAIKLSKDNESREVLVVGRRYLQEYGCRVMNLKIGKNRNELPKYTIRDDIPGEVILTIQSNVDARVYENEDRIENLASIEEQDENGNGNKAYDYSSGSSVVTSGSQPYDMSESAPPSPYSAYSIVDDDEMSYSSALSGRESLA